MVKPGAPLTLAALTALALVVAGCGGDDDGGSDEVGGTPGTAEDESSMTTEPDGGAPTTTAPLTPEEQAVAAYVKAWEAEFEALNPPNPEHPRIAESFTGVAAESIVGIIVEAQQDGHYTVGSMQTNPEPVSVTEQKVLLRDCTVEDSASYDSATNAVLVKGPYPPRSREVEVVNQNGTWRVSAIRTLEDSCTPA